MSYSVTIDCPVDKVYETMLDEAHYRKWTSVFNPASRYEGSWEEGSLMRFYGEDENGNTGGMLSKIRQNLPNRYISIEHLGLIENGKEITEGEQVEAFAGALENYRLMEKDGGTELIVEFDTHENWKDYFSTTWPAALQQLKQVCEEDQ